MKCIFCIIAYPQSFLHFCILGWITAYWHICYHICIFFFSWFFCSLRSHVKTYVPPPNIDIFFLQFLRCPNWYILKLKYICKLLQCGDTQQIWMSIQNKPNQQSILWTNYSIVCVCDKCMKLEHSVAVLSILVLAKIWFSYWSLNRQGLGHRLKNMI